MDLRWLKKGFIAEFKEFIARGNVMDLAVGVIIGGAFQSIVNSLVNDMIMPVISLLTGGVNFSNWVIRIGSGENDTIKYGNFYYSGDQLSSDGTCYFLFCKSDEQSCFKNRKAA